MPDRYGEHAEPDDAGPADGWRAAATSSTAAACATPTASAGGFPCDHLDHAGAARRGMDMIRATMGWTR